MAKGLINRETVEAIANAIRTKLGTTKNYYPDEMADAILAISGGGSGGRVPVLTSLEVTKNGVYTPEEGVDGFNSVTVNVQQNPELEYLEPNGEQYIKTGIYPSSDTKIEIKVCRDVFTDQALFGSRRSSSSNDRFASFMSTATGPHCQFYNQSYSLTYDDMTGVDVVITLSKNGYYYDDVLLTSVPQTAFTSSYELYLFGLNQANAINRPISDIKIYYCKIWQNDVLVRDFVPVLLGGAIVCLYDKVNEKYYLNAGTGDFTAGPVKE